LTNLIRGSTIRALTSDIELLVNGVKNIDIDRLKENTEYDNDVNIDDDYN
jgi:hypothetical protein